MSTLITYMKVDVFHVADNRPIFDRLYTFRRDTDEAWLRAEEFLAGQINARN